MSKSTTDLSKTIKLDSPQKGKELIYSKKRQSIQNANISKLIFDKLNERTVLNFILVSNKSITTETNFSETPKEMDYKLSSVKKFEEDLNSSLSFISDFKLDNDNDENEPDESFNSSFDDNSVEEIDITSKK
jgi:hypothetical protein